MSVKDVRRILEQVNEPNEFQMEEVNLTDQTHFIYKVSNCKIKDMDVRFDNLRPDHARFDIFINGQFRKTHIRILHLVLILTYSVLELKIL